MRSLVLAAVAALAFASAASAAPAPGTYSLNAAGKCMGPAPKTTLAAQTKCAAAAKPAPAASAAPAGATGKCKDGTYTMSKTHSGACSHHGGVANWL